MAITFLKDQPTEDDKTAIVRSYLEKHAPEIAALIHKDMTVGDVHATTALGNEKDTPGKKRRRFQQALDELTVEPVLVASRAHRLHALLSMITMEILHHVFLLLGDGYSGVSFMTATAPLISVGQSSNSLS